MSTQFEIYPDSNNKEVVYLVDGSAYIYRAYHAIKGLFNSKGHHTNAVFGFVRMLMKFLAERSPEYVAVFFDVKGPTFRHDQYKEYKANRPPMPKDLVHQLPWIKQAVSGFGISFFEKVGFEADDLIGTTARILQKTGKMVIIMSGDKDMVQLVTENCIIWDPMKNIVIDIESIKDKFGLKPEQMLDVMGFSGDRADNIPGVPGVGLKTALELVAKFHTMEGCYENIEMITKQKQKNNLLKFKEQAFLSRRLVTIDIHSPIKIKLEDLVLSKLDKQHLFSLFKELEFKQLQKKFTESLNKLEKNYVVISNEKLLENLMVDLSICARFAFDIETDSVDPMIARLIGISVSMKINEAFYIPIAHDYQGVSAQLPVCLVLDKFRPILANPNIGKIGQNIKNVSVVLLSYGISLNGIEFDTMLASYLIDPSKRDHNLDQIAMDFLSCKRISYRDLIGKGRDMISFKQVFIGKAANYACESVDLLLELSNLLIPILEQASLADLMRNVEIPLIPVLMRMEVRGIGIDRRFMRKLSISIQKQLDLLEDKIYKAAGETFNINSSQQLGYILFERLKLPFQKKTKTKKEYSTDFTVLTKLVSKHIVPVLVLKYRTLKKLKSTYVDSILNLINPYTGRIHTSFNQMVTATGRLSSSNPNLQNIPIRTELGQEIRKGFISAENCYFLSADYSQIELRILAHYSKDQKLINAFEKDEDIHVRTGSEIFQISPEKIDKNLRRQAKVVNFGIIYGMSAYRLARELNISNKKAQMYINNYFERYKGVKGFIDKMISLALRTKKTNTLLGRIRHHRDICSANMVLKKVAERTVLNTVIQGTAADLIKIAMINIDKALIRGKLRTGMLLSVHDEIIFEVPYEELEQVEELVKRTMESVANLLVPLKTNVLYGKNWAEIN